MTEETAAENVDQLATEDNQNIAESAPVDTEESTRDRGAERRIKQLTARAKTAEAELASLKSGENDRLSEIEKRLEVVAPSNPRPNRDDFMDDNLDVDEDSYIDAVMDWKLSQNKSSEPQVTQPEVYESDMMSVGKDKYTDFDDVVKNENVPFTREIIEAVENSNYPEDILYLLAKDPAKVFDLRINPDKINAVVAEIGAGIKPAVSKSDPPTPIEPIGGSGDNTASVDPTKMTTAQYMAARRTGKI